MLVVFMVIFVLKMNNVLVIVIFEIMKTFSTKYYFVRVLLLEYHVLIENKSYKC